MDEFYGRKQGRGSDFNYDLYPLINDFSFSNLIECATRDKQNLEDYGAIIVITDKQYIIGYTAGYGAGTHDSAFARVMKELSGGGIINNFTDSRVLTEKCKKNYITARIYYSKMITNYGSDYSFNGFIDFDLTNAIITPSKFEVFKLLYDKYNGELLQLAFEKNPFNVTFSYRENGRILKKELNSLDALYTYLENNITNSEITFNETIVGSAISKVIK